MKRLFVIAFVVGLLAVVLAATLWPLPQHLRYRSITSVPADGGRQEEFVIHWPEDRIARPGENASGLPAAARIIRPGQAVTMDFSPARLNLLLDGNDRIVRAYCG